MLKKCGVAAIIIMMAISFTIGSVDPILKSNSSSSFSEGFMPAIAEVGPHDERMMTKVILDLRERDSTVGLRPWSAPDPSLHGPYSDMKPGHDREKMFIEGRMLVTPSGSDVPRMFPVMFIRHHEIGGPGMMPMVSYQANATYKLNDSEDSAFVFAGEIILANETVSDEVSGIVSNVYDNNISSGQTNWHQATVTGSPASLNFQLKWNNSDDELRVVVYAPDGTILGPYTDDSDGVADDCINMAIDNPAGVADGQWSFKVTSTGVTGKDEYYLKTW